MAEMMTTGGVRCRQACFRGRSLGRPKPAVSLQTLAHAGQGWHRDDDRANLVLHATGLFGKLGRPKHYNSDIKPATVALKTMEDMARRRIR